jgi:hypothetical protein
MKFLKTKKYSILSNILKFSFVGVFVFALLFSYTFIKTGLANTITASTSNITSSGADIVLSGLETNPSYVVHLLKASNNSIVKSQPVNNQVNGRGSTRFDNLLAYTGYNVRVDRTSSPIVANVASLSFKTNAEITSFTPASGKWDDTITIIGTNLGSATKVIFGEFLAGVTPEVVDPNTIKVKVPRAAVTGRIYVEVPGAPNAQSSTDFIVNTNSEIISISPVSGKVGSLVTITGNNFNNVTGVFFNTTKAVTITNTPGIITVNVPPEAKTGKITVKTASGDAVSSEDFTVSSTGGSTATCTDGIKNQDETWVDTGGVCAPLGDGTPNPGTRKIEFHGIVPICNTGEIDPETNNYVNSCDFDMVMTLINKVINFLLITMATPLFALIIVYVGWLYLSDMGSTENVKKAKKILKNAIIGYVIALAAWLIVKTILVTVGFNLGDSFLKI